MQMKSLSLGICSALLFVAVACQEDGPEHELIDELVGPWLLFETGGSPGSGYIVNPVPAEPPQTITFFQNGDVKAHGIAFRDWQDLRRYDLYTSATENSNFSAIIFKRKGNNDLSEMHITIKNDTLILAPPCFEGCHYGFVRID